MTLRPRSLAVAPLLIYVLSALVPPVLPCPIDWERIPLATFVRCSVALENVPAPCTRVARPPRAEALSSPPCARGRQSASCPTRDCPFRTATTPARSEAAGSRSRHGRAYRLGDPAGGASVRAQAVALVSPPPAFGVGSASALAPPPVRLLAWRPEACARPPDPRASRTPPVRGPP